MGDGEAQGRVESNVEPHRQSKVKTALPGRRFYVVLLVLLVLGFLIQWNADAIVELVPAFGRAFPNILILPLVFVGLFSLMRWFLWGSVYRWQVKTAGVLVILSLPIIFKIEHGGDLFSYNVRLRMFSPDQFMSMPKVDSAGVLPRDDSASATLPFLGFLGSDRSGRIPGVELESWSIEPPTLVWRRNIGAGWSAFAATQGIAVTQEQRGDQELVTAYNLQTGKPIWFHAEPLRHEDELGGIGPRATPTLEGNQVFAQGATGILVCLDLETGRLIWRRNIVRDVGSDEQADLAAIVWGRSGSPLVEGDLVIVPGGGRNGQYVSLIAYDRSTGDIVWRGGDQQISYSSPVAMTLGGRRQIVIVNEASVSGHDPTSGKELWRHVRPGHSGSDANTSQPQQVDDRHLLVTKGYGLGGELLEILPTPKGETDDADASQTEMVARSVWSNPRVLRTKLTSAILHDGRAFALNEGILECVDLNDGSRLWKGDRYRHGQMLIVGDDLILLSEDGDLYLVPANAKKSKRSPAIHALSGNTWNNLCLWGEYLIVRNAQEAACFRLQLRPPPAREVAQRNPSKAESRE
jgi:outer membrane protein assembly factor BamB